MARKAKKVRLSKHSRLSKSRTARGKKSTRKTLSLTNAHRSNSNMPASASAKNATKNAKKRIAQTKGSLRQASQKSRAKVAKKPKKSGTKTTRPKVLKNRPSHPTARRRKEQKSPFDRARSALRPKIRKNKKRKSVRKQPQRTKNIRRIRSKKPIKNRTKKITKRPQRKRIRRSFRIFSEGKALQVKVSLRTARVIGRYLSAVGRFLDTNDVSQLKPYVGVSIKDTRGRVYPLETRPNVLYRLNAAVEPFEEIYRLVA